MAYIIMAYIIMACMVMASIVLASIVMAYPVMAYTVMAYTVMAHTFMAYTVMAHTVMALYSYGSASIRSPKSSARHQRRSTLGKLAVDDSRHLPHKKEGAYTPHTARRALLEVEDKKTIFLIFNDFSAHTDGERRGSGSDREGGHRKGRGETRLEVPSDRRGPSAVAVGMLRDI